MTHSLTIEIPETVYRAMVKEAEAKKRRVEEIVLERLAKDEPDRETEDFEKLADELADYFEKNMSPDVKPLSDYAVSREGIYEDHL